MLRHRPSPVVGSRYAGQPECEAAGDIFQLFLPDEDQFANLQLWKNLLLPTCRESLRDEEVEGQRVQVWGCGTELASNG